MNNIILFATYWNEIEWIRPSLDQILKIDPIEIIICDGNFDPRVENYSTDGTREIIEQFVAENSNRATMISAERTNKWNRGLRFFKEAGHFNESIQPSRLKYSFLSQFIINEYRVNQALTFAKMMNLSQKWAAGRWVMSYDADQFYTDELIENFSVTNDKTNFDLITADEWTFPHNFSQYTTKYEKRKWNNMPHKIKKRLAIYPTRHFMLESFFSYKHYHNSVKKYHAGVYHHYKFRRDAERLAAGYQLGDRKPPEDERYQNLTLFKEKYPSTARDLIV